MAQDSRIVRFGVFEANLNAGELRKHGLKIRLPEQAFQILTMLLEHPGEMVTRAELREKLWPGRPYVDFEQGLNKAVNRLRNALGDSGTNPRFVGTVPRRGYRLLAPVMPGLGHPAAAQQRIRLAVLPFENVGADPEQEFFSDGLTEEMISELGRLSPARLGIIARTSAMRYKNSGKRIDEIGKELAVDYILEGSVRRVGERSRITTQLIHVGDQTHLWSQSYDRELADIFEIQREVAQRVADSLAFELLPEAQTRRRFVVPEAHEAYLRGRYFWNRGNDADAWKAIEWYERALEHDPAYALAHAGIADCHGRLVWYSAALPLEGGAKAKRAAARALELDAELSEAHASMALVHFWYEWDWAAAEREFKRSTELRPNYAEAHNWYAAFLNAMGRCDEAAPEQKLAEELDPLSLTIAMNGADPHYFKRRFDPAIEQLERVLAREPRFFPAQYNLGRAYALKGMHPEAIAAIEMAARLSGNRQASAALAFVYARVGRTGEARAILSEMEQAAAVRYLASPQFALVHLGLGETDRALDWLKRGFEERSYFMIYLQADPFYDELRSQPRFTLLLDKMGFPGHRAASLRLAKGQAGGLSYGES
jgi:TolB-like protein/Tfp pilus assembly protein PilF